MLKVTMKTKVLHLSLGLGTVADVLNTEARVPTSAEYVSEQPA